MVQIQNNSRKNMATSLRRGGYSYSEIQNFVSVSKATLSYWFRELKLSEPQLARLQKKRSEAARAGTQKRSENVSRTIEHIEMAAATDIGKFSKRELWLMGVILYWRNYNLNDVKKGVSFSSSDPYLVRLFLKWLKDVGQLSDKEITFDIFVAAKGKANSKKIISESIEFWANCVGAHVDNFKHIYPLRQGPPHGILRLRVKASSMLARQLSGWIKGIQEILYK